jgi:hypothetical protein
MNHAILSPGEKIHVLHRFDKEIRRHFVGEVEVWHHDLARATGYVFVVDDPQTHAFVRRPDKRTKVIALNDGELVINILPRELRLEALRYEVHDHRLYLTDGKSWRMDIKEFGWD